MYHYFEAITNTRGDALIGYYVRAVDAGTGSAASLYADTSRTPIISVSEVANAAKVDSDGNASFYIDAGTYHLDIYATDSTTLVKRISDVPMNIDLNTVSVSYVTTRPALASLSSGSSPAYLGESGREGQFVWDGSNLSTLVTADTAQGLYVAPATDTTGASGAWVRKFKGPAESTWFGVSTSATAAANVTAFTAALACLKALRVTGRYNDTSIGLHTPAGHYNFDNTLTPDHALEISGDNIGGAGGGTVFEWTANVHGFLLNGYDGSSVHANGVRLKGLHLKGTNAGTAKHAINQNGYANIEDIFCENWSGDGIHAVGNSPGGFDGSTYRNIMGYTVGWTLYLDGNDSNACQSYNIGGSPVRFGAIHDRSGIGCHHVGGVCNSAGNVSGYVTRCYNNGHIFMVAYGQEAGASANSPPSTATSNTYWLYLSEGSASATQPQWTAAQTWYFSSPYCVDPTDENTRTRFEGHYVEVGLNAVILNGFSTAAGGQYLVPIYISTGARHGGYARGNGGWMLFNNALQTQGPYNNRFENAVSEFGPEADPGTAPDQELQLRNWNEYSIVSFYRRGTEVGRVWSAGTGHIVDFNQVTWRTNGGGTQLAQLTTTVYNLGSGIDLQFNGTTVPLRNTTASKLIGRSSAGAGVAQEITLGTGLAMSTTTLNLSGLATASGLTMNTGKLLGRSTESTGAIEELATVPAVNFPALTGDVTTAGGALATTIAANAVTYAKLQQVAASSLVGNATGSLANATGITLAGGLAFSGSTLTAAGALTPTSVASTGAITSSSASAGIGYATGAGGTVSQGTSRTTGVTLSKTSGAITLFTTTTTAGQISTFTVTNTAVAATDTILLAQKSGLVTGPYVLLVTAVAAGSFNITVFTPHAVASDAPVINFSVIKAVAA